MKNGSMYEQAAMYAVLKSFMVLPFAFTHQ